MKTMILGKISAGLEIEARKVYICNNVAFTKFGFDHSPDVFRDTFVVAGMQA